MRFRLGPEKIHLISHTRFGRTVQSSTLATPTPTVLSLKFETAANTGTSNTVLPIVQHVAHFSNTRVEDSTMS